MASPPPKPPSAKRRIFPQWPLATIGALAIVGAIFVIRHQSQSLAHLNTAVAGGNQSSVKSYHHPKDIVLHPVVTKTTSYPAGAPSSSHWTEEVESYGNAQLSVRVPVSMNTAQSSSANRWRWGTPNTPYRVVLGVVSAKPSDATLTLGTDTYGTPITHDTSTATQDLYVTWANRQWLEVSMTVPSSDSGWLEAIAESVRVS